MYLYERTFLLSWEMRVERDRSICWNFWLSETSSLPWDIVHMSSGNWASFPLSICLLSFHQLDRKPTGPGTHLTQQWTFPLGFLQDCSCSNWNKAERRGVLPDPGPQKSLWGSHPESIFAPPSSASLIQTLTAFFALPRVSPPPAKNFRISNSTEDEAWGKKSLWTEQAVLVYKEPEALFTWVLATEPLGFQLQSQSRLRTDPDSRRGFRLQATSSPICQLWSQRLLGGTLFLCKTSIVSRWTLREGHTHIGANALRNKTIST